MLLNNVVDVFAVEKYCMGVARHSCLRAANNKNVISKADCIENSPCIQDDEQVCCNMFPEIPFTLCKVPLLPVSALQLPRRPFLPYFCQYGPLISTRWCKWTF